MRISLASLVAVGALGASAVAFAPKSSPPLIDAVKREDHAAVRSLVKDGGSVNARDVEGTTALHWAVHHNDAETVDLLLRSGADVKATNRYGVMPLSLAAVNGSPIVIERLLKSGADANAMLPGGETVLMSAARTGNVESIKLLLAHGANPNAHDATGQTSLMWAAARDNAAAIRTLLEGGADLKAKTHGQTVGPRGEGTVAQLSRCSNGCFSFSAPTPTGFSALMFAVRGGQRNAMRTLIEAGADVNDKVSDGTSAMVMAVINGHWDIAAYLLDRGADPNASEQGWTALHQIAKTRRPNIGFGTPGAVPDGTLDSLELARKLIAKGAKVNMRMTKNGMRDGQRNRMNRLGATAFLMAAKSNDVEYMRLLVDAGADPLIATADGTTPLMAAAGTKVWNPGEDGGSLVGSEPEVLEAVKICVEHGNDVNAQNDRHETAMHGAAFLGANSVVEYLVSKGAKIDVRADPYGWTPLTIANGVFYSDFFKEQRHTAELLKRLYTERGISIEGHQAKTTDCLDCLQTRGEDAGAAVVRDEKMEKEFAAAQANH